ncbi:uncharacterized protein LOC130899782 [Diorhabda carinulata]|uniref:uncharacterized protein LOC130899782 n=1 Tax=Diorhabda carinulata TaxID=1163345 RepID=UPI0025A0BAEB|nr:uncharacterized protein LOC130899782 [Diorhabda carinulata]
MADSKNSKYEFRDNMFLLVSVLSGIIGAISDGMHVGYTSPLFYSLSREVSQKDLALDENLTKLYQNRSYPKSIGEEMLVKSFYHLGALLGVPVVILCEKISSKRVSTIKSTISLISWLIIVSTTSWTCLYIARTVAGISVSLTLIVMPKYLSEITSPKMSKSLNSLVYDPILIGVLVAYLVGPTIKRSAMPLLGVTITIIELILSFFMSESPYFLISKDRNLEAKTVLQKLRKSKFKIGEISIMGTNLFRNKRERKDMGLFHPMDNRKATIAVIVIISAQQFTGITAFLMSFHEILYHCNITQTYSVVISNIFILLIAITKYSHKLKFIKYTRSEIGATIISTIALLVLATYLALKNHGFSLQEMTWIPVISFIAFGAAFTFDKGYLPIDIVDTYYPNAFKSSGLIFATFIQIFGAWISVELFQRLDFSLVIYIFAFNNVVSSLIIKFCISPISKREMRQFGGNDETIANQNEDRSLDDGGIELFGQPQANTAEKMTVAVTSENIFKGTFPQLVAVLAGTLTAVSDGMQYGWTSPVLPLLMEPNSPVTVTKHQGTISAISDGMQYGWTSPTVPLLLSEDSPLEVTDYQAEWLESILMIGASCGLPGTMYLVDKIGRKKSLMTSAIVTAIAWIVMATLSKIWLIYLARFCAGMAGDMAFVAAPMYIAEIADQKIRGFLASFVYVMMLTGILLVYCVGPFVPMWTPCFLGFLINLIGLSIFFFQPESPYYLLYRSKPEEARAALKRLRKRDDIEEEFKDISLAIERQKGERGRFKDLFIVPSNRKALTIMVVLNSSQHMSSISVMLMNLQSILEEAGSYYIPAYTGAIIFSATMFIAAMTASLAIDNFGRKVLLCISGIMAGCSLLVLAIYFTLKKSSVDVSSASLLPLIMVLLYAASFKFGIGLVPVVLTAELFPATVKAFGMTLSDLSYVGFSVITLQIYHFLRHKFGIHVPFYIFACSCFCTVIFTLFYIPETKGKTLEEIQMILKGKSQQSYTNNHTNTEKITEESINCGYKNTAFVP